MTTTAPPVNTPTDDWLAAAPMPALSGPEGTAERLLLLIHYGLDWSNGWIGKYRIKYWDNILPDRLIAATFRHDSLRGWWREVAVELESSPVTSAQRQELEALLREPALPVLDVIRHQCEAVILRTRITTESVRTAKQQKAAS